MRFIGMRTFGAALSFAAALALPSVGYCDATSINGACVYGTCTTPDSIYNTSTSSSTFNIVNVGGSPFIVTTAFSATEFAGGGFTYNLGWQVTYIGAAPLASAETITIAFLQDFNDPAVTNWSGTYNYAEAENLDAGTSWTGTLELDGVSAIALGPFNGPGLLGNSGSAAVTLPSGSTLDFEQLESITFNAGDPYDTTVGESTTPTPVPEPSSLLLLATSLGVPATFLRRRFVRVR